MNRNLGNWAAQRRRAARIVLAVSTWRAVLIGGLVLPAVVPSVAQAQELSAEEQAQLDAKRANARKLATEASLAYRRGDYAAAHDGFNRAFQLVEAPSVGVWSARSLVQLSRFVEATERYREVIRAELESDAPPSHKQAQADAKRELDELLPRIPIAVIQVENAELDQVEVTMDGKPVAQALLGVEQRVDPGTHIFAASRGEEVVEQDVSFAERETKTVTLKLRKLTAYEAKALHDDSAEAEGNLRKAGLYTMGAGGVFLVGGIATMAIALGQQSELNQACPDKQCPPDQHGTVDSFETTKALSYVGYIGAGVLGATGATLYFLGGQEPSEPKLGAYFSGETVGLRGTF